MPENYDNVITQSFVNENIRPCTCNFQTFKACVNEVLMLDISNKLGDDVYDQLSQNDPSDELKTSLDNGLRTAIGYYVLSRIIRTVSATVTKYGYTTKLDDNSTNVEDAKIRQDSNYYKQVADEMMHKFIDMFSKPCTTSSYIRCRVIGD